MPSAAACCCAIPEQRWGFAEIRRWLDGDVTLPAPLDDTPPAETHAARPYHLEDTVCHTPTELAVALATHWQAGRKDLMRGQITAWAGQELKDQNLVRILQDLLDARGLSDDLRLLRLIRHLAPEIPAVWRGESLATCQSAGHGGPGMPGRRRTGGELAGFGLRAESAARIAGRRATPPKPPWRRAGKPASTIAWISGTPPPHARTNLRKEQTSIGGITDFDALVYGEPQGITPPEPAYLLPLLLLVLADDEHAAQFRTRVRLAAASLAAPQPLDRDACWTMATSSAGSSPTRCCPMPSMRPKTRKLRQKRDDRCRSAQRDALIARTNNALALLRETCEHEPLRQANSSAGSTGGNTQALLALIEEGRATGLAADTPLMRTLAARRADRAAHPGAPRRLGNTPRASTPSGAIPNCSRASAASCSCCSSSATSRCPLTCRFGSC